MIRPVTCAIGLGLFLSAALLGGCDETPTRNTMPDTVADTTPDTAVDTTPDTAVDTTPDTVADTTPDTVADTTPDTVADTMSDTVADTTPDTVADTTPDTVADTTPDTVADTTPDTVGEVIASAGKCVGAADQAIIDGATKDGDGKAYDPSGTAATCAIGCVGEADIFTCISDCTALKVPLTDDCNGCYAESAKCAIDYCITICLTKGSNSPECIQCLADEGCTPNFYTCSGLPVPGVGKCVGAADQAIIDGTTKDGDGEVYKPYNAANICAIGCVGADDAVACVSSCVKLDLPLTSACNDCYATSAQCAIEHCAAICLTMGTDAPDCVQCREDNGCTPEFYTCSGTTKPSQNRCVGVLDMAIIDGTTKDGDGDAYNVVGSAGSCAIGCIGGPEPVNCVVDCVTTEVPLTHDCNVCYSESATCTIEFCVFICLSTGSKSPECKQCQEDYGCTPDFYTCSGLAVPPVNKCIGAADMAIIDGTTKDGDGEAYDPSETATTCAIGCLGEADVFTCISDCAKADLPLTDGCTGCYAQSAHCAIEFCVTTCIIKGSNSIECTQCGEDYGCTPGFYTCSGLPVPPVGICAGAADMAIIDGTTKDSAGKAYDPNGIATSCTLGCLGAPDAPSCVFDCAKLDLPLTDACTDCYAQSAQCTIDSCAAICITKGGSSPECIQCSEDQGCTPAFYTCSGLPVPTY